MNILSLFLIYVMVWWVIFMMILSHGHQVEEKPIAGHDPGAPQNPRIGRKILITSLASGLVTVLIIIGSRILGFQL